MVLTSPSAQTPREAVMAGDGFKRRSTTRKILRLPAWMVFYRANLQRHVALVRDASRQGIFFYSDIQPFKGDHIDFVLRFPKWTNSGVIVCKGTVVRVEQATPGAHIGVAVRLHRYIILKEQENALAAEVPLNPIQVGRPDGPARFA
jgi:hypothetical protein